MNSYWADNCRRSRPWARRKHPTRSYKWRMRRYFPRIGSRNIFELFRKGKLRLHSKIPIQRHVKVKGVHSPFDGDWKYWTPRNTKSRSHRLTVLLNRQKGKCRWCGLIFRDSDIIEVDHIQPIAHGGGNTTSNLQQLLLRSLP